MWDELLNLLFPEECIGCGRSGTAMCAFCERSITRKPRALSAYSASLFEYRNPLVKKALWALKYERKRLLGNYFGNALYREFLRPLTRNEKARKEEFILIPIPASKKALAERGYNHAEVVANAIVRYANEDGLRFRVARNVLKKKNENEQQAKTGGRKARTENVADVFIVEHGETLAGKNVFIIDDIITTGATVAAARRALKPFGPKRMLALAAAH